MIITSEKANQHVAANNAASLGLMFDGENTYEIFNNYLYQRTDHVFVGHGDLR